MEGDKLAKDISKKPTGLVFVDRNRLYFYEQTLPNPLSLDIPPDVISDLEIINKKQLDNSIKTLISANNLVPTSIIILLSTSVTFEKEFPEGAADVNKGIEDFLDLIPFEDYLSKKIVTSEKTKIVAANREVYECIRDSFQSVNFKVIEVFPLSFFMDVYPQLASNLDLSLIVEKAPEMKQFNLIPQVESSSTPIIPKKESKDKKQLKILIAIFGLLIPVLLFLVYKNLLSAPESPKTLPSVGTPIPTAQPVNTNVPTISQSNNNVPVVTSSQSAEQNTRGL